MKVDSTVLLDDLAHMAVRIAFFDYGADDYENMDDPILRSTWLEFRDAFKRIMEEHTSNAEAKPSA